MGQITLQTKMPLSGDDLDVQHSPVPKAPSHYSAHSPEWEAVTKARLVLKGWGSWNRGLWFYFFCCDLKTKNWQESNLGGERVCFSSEVPVLIPHCGEVTAELEMTGHIRSSLEQRTTGTHVLSAQPALCTHKLGDGAAHFSTWIFPYQLRHQDSPRQMCLQVSLVYTLSPSARPSSCVFSCIN